MKTENLGPSDALALRAFVFFGGVLCALTGLLTLHTIWEETFLTWRNGPQMVGWAIIHIFPFALLPPIFLMLWLILAIVVLVVLLVKKRSPTRSFWLTLATTAICFGALSIPQQFWEWAFVGTFAKSPRAADLMTTDAAEGCIRTVRGYLDHGTPVDVRDSEGGTALHAAAVRGQLDVLQLLASKGADVNAIDNYGSSPLADAVDMKQTSAAAFLRAHGAKEIRPVKPPLPPADITVTVDGGKQ